MRAEQGDLLVLNNSMPLAFLEVTHLHKHYEDRPALRGVSLTVSAGEVLAVLGPSGSGKTTLLRLLAGLEDRDEGQIRLRGQSVRGPAERLVAGEPGVRLVAQHFDLFPNLTVAENVAYPLRGQDREAEAARTAELLALTDLTDLAHQRPRFLSGGERQRVALSRALADRPALLLLDEPFSHQDAPRRRALGVALRDIWRAEGTTVVLVTHDAADALALADRVWVLAEGSVVQVADPRTLYAQPATPLVVQLTGEANLLPVRAWRQYWPNVAPGVADERLGLVRPEALRFEPEAAGQPRAVVERVAFGGSTTALWLRLSDGVVLQVLVLGTGHGVGTAGCLTLPPDALWVFPEV